jgi:UDP-N-acetylglucosamine--N-acetylmuramyl-(pentapeptide) pyrophosphoryl-undecaprenol N-acetylglucosamine transferase
MTILFCGGGSMGPVTPLLAVLRRIRERDANVQVLWAVTPHGPERDVLSQEGIEMVTIPVAKLSRFPDMTWLTWPVNYLRAHRTAAQIFQTRQIDLVVGAGGFTQVPVMRVAKRKHIPCAIHQLDAVPTLSNRLVAAGCRFVTTSFSYEASPFRSVSSERIATPCRFAGVILPSPEDARRYFQLDPRRQTVFMFGGGTGAAALNQAVDMMRSRADSSFQIIHLTGRNKIEMRRTDLSKGYIVADFFDERQMSMAYAAADIVVSRAGIGAMSELACLKKAAIIVPIPGSHQEANADRFPFPVVYQDNGFVPVLEGAIQSLLADPGRREEIGEAAHEVFPTDDGTALAERWMSEM